jgi:TetR/AcrR family transcriptional regulator, repressor of the ameABC operon
MARPMTNIDAGRAQLLDVLEHLIRKRGAASITLGELAAEAGMSTANIYRFFANKEALYEASAERWFTPKIRIMEEVVAGDGNARDKLFDFFARRFRLMRDNYLADPDVFVSYLDLGDQHEEIIRGYIDLGDHYLAMIVAQAMDEGYFPGLSIDRTVSLINLMAMSFINPRLIIDLMHSLTEEKVGEIVGAMLAGLKGAGSEALAPRLAIV